MTASLIGIQIRRRFSVYNIMQISKYLPTFRKSFLPPSSGYFKKSGIKKYAAQGIYRSPCSVLPFPVV